MPWGYTGWGRPTPNWGAIAQAANVAKWNQAAAAKKKWNATAKQNAGKANPFGKKAQEFYRALASGRTEQDRQRAAAHGYSSPARAGGDEKTKRAWMQQAYKDQQAKVKAAKIEAARKQSGVRGEPNRGREATGASSQSMGPGKHKGKGKGKDISNAQLLGAQKPLSKKQQKNVYKYQAQAYQNALNQPENLPTGAPREVRPGVMGVDFPGGPSDWLERARQIEGIDDATWASVKPLYEEGSRQEGAANVYQHGYRDVNTGGNEAFGPAQITPGTFEAWKNPAYGNRYNPVHNYIAMLRGLKNKYGSYQRGGQVIARPGGYG